MRKLYSIIFLSVFLIFSLFHALPAASKTGSQTEKAARTLAGKNDKKKTSAIKEAKKNKKPVSTQADTNRDLWLKRAKNSHAFTGNASWYGKDFHNKPTASGLPYDMHTFTAAHRTLPLGTIVKVTDQHNGKSVMVCVTDRGPYAHGRIIDLSYAAAKKLGLEHRGVGKVALEVVGNQAGEPVKKDQSYFVKYHGGNGKNKVGPFNAFADAAAMQDALLQAHPEAEVVMEKNPEK